MKITHTFGIFSLIKLAGTQKFLFLKRSDYKDRNPLHRDIPGGGLNIGEQIEESIWRELKEEIGIEVTDGQKNDCHYLGTWSRWTNTQHTRWSTVLFYTIEIQQTEIILSSEHTKYKRLTLEECLLLKHRQDVVDEAIKLYNTYSSPNPSSPKIEQKT